MRTGALNNEDLKVEVDINSDLRLSKSDLRKKIMLTRGAAAHLAPRIRPCPMAKITQNSVERESLLFTEIFFSKRVLLLHMYCRSFQYMYVL
jgi:hypothetical protein